MDYVEGTKFDVMIDKLDRLTELIEYDLIKKYPELSKTTKKPE